MDCIYPLRFANAFPAEYSVHIHSERSVRSEYFYNWGLSLLFHLCTEKILGCQILQKRRAGHTSSVLQALPNCPARLRWIELQLYYTNALGNFREVDEALGLWTP
jgi:hypothetical protein